MQDGGGKPRDGAGAKWRASLRAGMKQSLKMLQSRIGERAALAREAERQAGEAREARKAKAKAAKERESGGDAAPSAETG